MVKLTKESFFKRVSEIHKDKYSFEDSVFEGLSKPIEYKCPVHGTVSQVASKVLKNSGCPKCDTEKATKSRRSGKYARNKGHNYETKLCKELADCGYPNVVTSRKESKRMDDQKVDLVDLDNRLPILIQAKCTANVPNFFKIKNAYKRDKPFCIFWNRQEVKEGHLKMSSAGEVVMIDKDFFYELLKKYNNE